MTFKQARALPVGRVLTTKTGDGIAAIQRHTEKCRALRDAGRGWRQEIGTGVLRVIITA